MRLAFCKLNGLSGHDAGRNLLAQLYREETGQDLPPISIAPMGKPFFPDNKWHFSISHTQSHAFCVLSEHHVGLDAEALTRTISPKLADKILSPGERAQYEAAPDKNKTLLTFWVLKEADAKRTGQGLRLYPNHTNFTLPHPGIREVDGCLVAILEEITE